ncbi:MAG: NAD(P)-binding domain-containing protein, partial [Clostridia bacterium]
MDKSINVTVLGCGRWGSFLAWYCNRIGHNVTVWGRSGSKSFEVLEQTHANEYVTLDDEIKLESNFENAVEMANVVIISISAQQLRSFLSGVDIAKLYEKKVILCMKGIETATGK